jgi:hypothetical protein
MRFYFEPLVPYHGLYSRMTHPKSKDFSRYFVLSFLVLNNYKMDFMPYGPCVQRIIVMYGQLANLCLQPPTQMLNVGLFLPNLR